MNLPGVCAVMRLRYGYSMVDVAVQLKQLERAICQFRIGGATGDPELTVIANMSA